MLEIEKAIGSLNSHRSYNYGIYTLRFGHHIPAQYVPERTFHGLIDSKPIASPLQLRPDRYRCANVLMTCLSVQLLPKLSLFPDFSKSI
jgi:hypothetical protein